VQRSPNRLALSRRLAASLCLGLAALACVSSLSPSPAFAAPEPNLAPRTWEINFEHGSLQVLSVRDAEGKPRWFYFLPYKVTNTSGRELVFAPDVTVADDEGHIISVNADVPSRAFEAVRKQLGNSLLESPVQIIGKLLQGPDHARESAIIFPINSARADKLTIFIAGLSGETAIVTGATSKEPIIVRKTYMLEYALPGDPSNPQKTVILPLNEQWIMR
jgi:hypothetical protein